MYTKRDFTFAEIDQIKEEKEKWGGEGNRTMEVGAGKGLLATNILTISFMEQRMSTVTKDGH